MDINELAATILRHFKIRQSIMNFIVLLVLPIFSFGQIKLEQKMSFLDEKVVIFTPKELSKMKDEMWKIKYGNAQRPVLALSDKDIEVNLIAQFTNQKWFYRKLCGKTFFFNLELWKKD